MAREGLVFPLLAYDRGQDIQVAELWYLLDYLSSISLEIGKRTGSWTWAYLSHDRRHSRFGGWEDLP